MSRPDWGESAYGLSVFLKRPVMRGIAFAAFMAPYPSAAAYCKFIKRFRVPEGGPAAALGSGKINHDSP